MDKRNFRLTKVHSVVKFNLVSDEIYFIEKSDFCRTKYTAERNFCLQSKVGNTWRSIGYLFKLVNIIGYLNKNFEILNI